MASLLNIPACGDTGTGNTGFDICKIIRSSAAGGFLADPAFKLTPSDMESVDTIIAALQTATLAARGARVYPLPAYSNAENNNTEATRSAIGNINTATVKTNEGIPGMRMQHYDGEYIHRKLAAFESQTVRWCFYDKNFVLFGWYDSDGNFHPYDLTEFYVDFVQTGTGAETSKYPYGVTLKSAFQYKNRVAFLQLDSRLGDLLGIKDVNLSVFNHTTNVVKIKALVDGSSTNLIELFNAELDVAGAWSVTKQSDGTAFTVTTYAYDSNNKVMTITLDSTAYTALASAAKIDINLVSAAALDALNVSPYESTGKVTITKA
jgi:hypothetical protein